MYRRYTAEQAREQEKMVQASEMPHVEFISRVSKLPMVNSAINYATDAYGKAKDISPYIVQRTLSTAEDTVKFAANKAAPVANKLNKPLNLVDSLACKTLDVVEDKFPVVTRTPEEIVTDTKNYVNDKLQPVHNGMDSARSAVNMVTERGVSAVAKTTDVLLGNPLANYAFGTVHSALNVADHYVDYFLPPKADAVPEEKSAFPEAASQKVTWSVSRAMCLTRKVQDRVLDNVQQSLYHLSSEGVSAAGALIPLLQWLKEIRLGFIPTELPAYLRTMLVKIANSGNEADQPPEDSVGSALWFGRRLTNRVEAMAMSIVNVLEHLPTAMNNYSSLVRQQMDKAVVMISEIGAYFVKTTNIDNLIVDALVQIQQHLPLIYTALAKVGDLSIAIAKRLFRGLEPRIQSTAEGVQQSMDEKRRLLSNHEQVSGSYIEGSPGSVRHRQHHQHAQEHHQEQPQQQY